MGLIGKFKRYRQSQQARKGAPQAKQKTNFDKEMSFLDHLEELRWHLVRSLAAILVVGIVIFIYRAWVTRHIYLAPFSKDFPLHRWLCDWGVRCFDTIDVKYTALGPYDQFLLALGMAFVGGFVMAFPIVLWEAWRFIKPGLYRAERRRFRGGVWVLSLLFFIGVLFSYYIITPFAVTFLANFKLDPAISNDWRINRIVGMVNKTIIAGGLVFELPMLVYILSKMGVVTPQGMRKYWRHSVVVMLILSAIITPPDVLSQILIFFPLALLYRGSILISAAVNRKRERDIFGEDHTATKSPSKEASAHPHT